MEPLADETSLGAPERLRLSRRKLTLAGVALLAVAVAVAVAVVLLRSTTPGEDEVAAQIRAAITQLTPAKGADGTDGRFDTAALRQLLSTGVEGWYVDLAADGGATRVGVAARQLEGSSCVFVWSGVGGPLSAIVTDPALPCTADIALIPAKAPA